MWAKVQVKGWLSKAVFISHAVDLMFMKCSQILNVDPPPRLNN